LYYFLNLLQDNEDRNDAFLRHWLFINMPFNNEDKVLIMVLIKNVLQLKGCSAKHLVREFPSKGWNVE